MGRLILRSSLGGAASDSTPDAFSFTDQTNVALSSTITSSPITITGINTGTTISITGGTYDVNGSGSFTSSSATVNLNDTIRARHTSSGSNNTATNTVVTIGGVSDTFTSTTVAAGGGFTTESSGLTYQNLIQTDLNYANETAAVAAGIISGFRQASSGPTTEHTFVADPAGGGSNVWRMRVRSDEDGWLFSIPVSPSASYMCAEWEEYYDPAWDSAYTGKMCRMYALPQIEHILYGTANKANDYGMMGQGSDGMQNIDAGTASASPRGTWFKLSMECYLHPSLGYMRARRNTGAGWGYLNCRYNFNGSYSLQNSFEPSSSSGATAAGTGRKFTRFEGGGWYSGAPNQGTGSTNYRYFRNVKVYYNDSSAPTEWH